jgi:predicted XRE-type DNA-binding protein
MARKREKVEAGSGNVFTDLGFADAGERRLRVQLAMRINELIADGGLKQARAAQLFGVPQPHVSELKNYKLDRDVEIVIRPKAKRRGAGHLVVSVA